MQVCKLSSLSFPHSFYPDSFESLERTSPRVKLKQLRLIFILLRIVYILKLILTMRFRSSLDLSLFSPSAMTRSFYFLSSFCMFGQVPPSYQICQLIQPRTVLKSIAMFILDYPYNVKFHLYPSFRSKKL